MKFLIILSFVFLSGCTKDCVYEYYYDNTVCHSGWSQQCGILLSRCDNGMEYDCVINVKNKRICKGE